MKNLKNLADYVKNSKKFLSTVLCDFGGITEEVTNCGYDPKDKIYYLFCNEDDNPIPLKSILADSYKYPIVNIVAASETLLRTKEINSFSTLYGIESFGEGNSLVIS